MRALLAAAVVAAALLAWWLLAPPRPPADVPDPDSGRDAPSSEAPGPAGTGPSLTAAPAKPGPRETPPRTGRDPVPPVRGKASLLVVPVPAAGGTVPSDLRTEIELVGGRLATHPLPTPLQDGSLRYESLPPGPYRVRLFSDVLVDTVVEVTLRDGAEERVEAKLVPGGFARVKVTFLDGEAPPLLTYALRDGRGRPVAARYEGRSEAGPTTSPRRAEQVTMPAEVVVTGLEPGTYMLRATTPSGEFDEGKVEVAPAAGATLALKVRR